MLIQDYTREQDRHILSYGTYVLFGEMCMQALNSAHHVRSTKTGTEPRLRIGAGFLKVKSKPWQGAYVRVSQVRKMSMPCQH